MIASLAGVNVIWREPGVAAVMLSASVVRAPEAAWVTRLIPEPAPGIFNESEPWGMVILGIEPATS